MTAVKLQSLLDTELQTFRAHRNELLGRARGRFVLIKGTDVIDVFESEIDAISRGFKTFGNQSFLVKQITEFDAPLHFAGYNIGE
jgi:hypothetical protein